MDSQGHMDEALHVQDGDIGNGEEIDLNHYFKGVDDASLLEPLVVRRRVKALKKLLAEGMKIESHFYDEISALERKYENLFQPLYAKRLQITTGKYDPKDEECDFPEESDTAYELLRKAKMDKGDEENETNFEGIPQFWLTSMKNVGVLAEMIEHHDEPVLQYLDNISVQLISEPAGFKVHFEFVPNEFFTNHVLTKSYDMKNQVDDKDPLSYDGPEITNCQGCTINWNEGRNVTQILREKKCKDKNGKIRLITEKFKVPSFFDFFNPPEIPTDPNFDMNEDILVQLTRDFDIGQFIRETFVPRAVMHYTGEAESTDRGSDDECDTEVTSDYDGLQDDFSNMSMKNEATTEDPYDE